MGHFFLETGVYGVTFKFPAARPYQNQTWIPHGPEIKFQLSVCIDILVTQL